MESQLFSLSRIFTERLFRIPDYQRGYAWTSPQLKDFWTDLNQIGEDRNHYTGVLHLESVEPSVYQNWEDDQWIVEAKGFEPTYVVDGQQRLTTSIILIQSIIEILDEDERLNFTKRVDIQRKFIFDTKDDGGISRSYIFGYEKDNPSYEYLKTGIFGEFSSTHSGEETIYTTNLRNAKKYFADQIRKLNKGEIENVYKKLTQNFLFNIFTISDAIDVCVAFETMNNRGKRLSYLELLKNRLIYLSLEMKVAPEEKTKLRSAINDCWKSIYFNLGRNTDNPLDDDQFLRAHWTLHNLESKSKSRREIYQLFHNSNTISEYSVHDDIPYSNLLREIFVPRNIAKDDPDKSPISVNDINDYVISLQIAVEKWYRINNPKDIHKIDSVDY